MQINYFTIIATAINFVILFTIIIGIYKATKWFRDFINRNKEMDKKIDNILNKLEDKEDKRYK